MNKSALFALLLLSSPAFASGFGAIAYSPSTGKWGAVYGDSDAATAQNDAIADCGLSDCASVAESHNDYAALAIGDHGYGTANAASQQEAIDAALAACAAQTTRCVSRQWISAFDSSSEHQDVSGQNRSLDQQLDAVGGPFSYVIPHLKGFTQEQDKWCWDAATKTIYYALTGAQLDEPELARLQFKAPDPSKDYSDGFSSFSAEDCQGGEATSDRCNHGGYTPTALWYLGKAYPKSKLPGADRPFAILKLIRQSIARGLPVGLVIDWDGSGAHEIVIYGATFLLHQGQLKTVFEVYDPWNGKTGSIESSPYRPDYGGTGRPDWSSLAIVDFNDPAVRRVSRTNCPLLTDADQHKFCRAGR